MSWELFLDDIRKPDKNMTLAKSVDEAIDLINKNGFPEFISFDHDLGEDVPSGKDLVNIICDNVLDLKWSIPYNFKYQVHSDNTVGAENIRCLMNNLLKHLNHNFNLGKTEPYSSRKNR